MKKIAFLHVTGAPILKGNEIGFTEGGLVHILSASADLKKDYQIEVICPNLPGNRGQRTITYRGVKIVCLGSSSWVRQYSRMPSLSFYRRAYSYISRQKPDVIIGNNFLASALLRILPPRTAKIGVIHHLYYARNSESEAGPFAPTIRRIGQLEKLAIRFLSLNGMGAISPQVKRALAGQGYPADRIVIVGNGVDLGSYPFSPHKVPNSLIYIGRLAELKGVELLIDLLAELRTELASIRLHIVGEGPKEDEIRERIQDLKVSDSVTLHGYLTETEKIRLLRQSAIYVSNSQFEGFGIPLVEAMATGAVPVVSDIDSHRWVFQGEQVGYLVRDQKEMTDKVLRLLKDERERQCLARRGRRLVERVWTWTKVGQRYRTLVEQSLTNSRASFSTVTARNSG